MIPNQQHDPAGERSTHAVDIVAFVEANELAPHHVETPYRLMPAPGGEQLYTLLRDTLEQTGRIAIAYVVIQAHHHLAALVPSGPLLMLNTLRWTREAPEVTDRRRAAAPDCRRDAEDIELALMTQEALRLTEEAEARDADTFRADILTPEFLTEDDDETDLALSHALRRHSGMHGSQPYRRQHVQRRYGRPRPRLLS